MDECTTFTTAANSSYFNQCNPSLKITEHTLKGANLKMRHYLNTNKLVKSFVLAGALSIGVLAGGHFTEAAGPDTVKVEHSVHVKSEVTVKAKKATKSQASVHASETAKMHAAPNSAVHGKAEKVVKDEVATEETVK